MSSLLDPVIQFVTNLDDGDLIYVVRPGAPVGQRARKILGSDLKAGLYTPPFGTTLDRPDLTASDAGFMYFDTTLGRPVWWSGTGWVDATGAGA